MVGAFKRPWHTNKEEIAVLDAETWHPSEIDMYAVADSVNKIRGKLTDVQHVANIGEVIGALKWDSRKVERPPHVVQRLNIFAHGNPGIVSLSGKTHPNGDVDFDLATQEKDSDGKLVRKLDPMIDLATLSWLNEDPVGRGFREIARSKLHENAEIWLCLCNGAGIGKSWELAQTMANTFGAVVYAYDTEFYYHVVFDRERGAILSRTTTSIGENGHQELGYYSMEKVFYLDKNKGKQRFGEHMKRATAVSPKHVIE